MTERSEWFNIFRLFSDVSEDTSVYIRVAEDCTCLCCVCIDLELFCHLLSCAEYGLDQEPFKGQMRFPSYPQRHFLSHPPDARFFISGQQVLYGIGNTSAVPEYDAAAEAMTSRSLCLPLPVGQDRSISRSYRANAGSRKPEL